MAVSRVAADRDYPQMIAETDHAEPAPGRVRATPGGELIFDSTQARYVREWPYYPQYYIPVEDVDERFLVDEHHEQRPRQGTARRHGLQAGGVDRPGTVRVFGDEAIVTVYSSGAIGRLVPEAVTGLSRYLREHASAPS